MLVTVFHDQMLLRRNTWDELLFVLVTVLCGRCRVLILY